MLRRLLPAGVIAALLLAVLLGSEPLPQDPAYHDFADGRRVLGISNALNVLSNLPFLLVGLHGLWLLAGATHPRTRACRAAWLLFFAAVVLTAFGSAAYHLRPDNASLAWDRLPMTIAFMSLATIVIAEFHSATLARSLLWLLVALGIAAVGYWAVTEAAGRGDLRPYVLVQFLPMLAIPLVVLLRGRRSDLSPALWWVVGVYLAAKLTEYFDAAIYRQLAIVSGHTLKHLVAALAPAMLLIALRQREARPVQSAALTTADTDTDEQGTTH